ncbi:MAG: substrate-binding domain-containing protein [Planctomycetota bacterium]|jgi:DNA-binding LacI/PurR family transcriptional regulator
MRKTRAVCELIRERVANADDMLSGLPGERRLAEELGVSRTTVRSAIGALVDEGVLQRKPNGRVTVSRHARRTGARMGIGFIMPASASADHQLWLRGARAAVEGTGIVIRPVTFAHDGDASLHQALGGFDASFLIIGPSGAPRWMLDRLRSPGSRVVVLDLDLSDEGIPSVALFPTAACLQLLGHLHDLGHRHIDCINTQAEDQAILERVSAWRQFIESRGLMGTYRTLETDLPIEAGYQLMSEALREGRSVGTAFYCTTCPAAIGVMRALHEAGHEVGVDASVCAVNDEGYGRFLLKSLTSLPSPPRARYLRPLVEWMAGGGEYDGPLLVQPEQIDLFIGESTGPAPKRGRSPKTRSRRSRRTS